MQLTVTVTETEKYWITETVIVTEKWKLYNWKITKGNWKIKHEYFSYLIFESLSYSRLWSVFSSHFTSHGVLRNFNTVEDFQNCDMKELLHEQGYKVKTVYIDLCMHM